MSRRLTALGAVALTVPVAVIAVAWPSEAATAPVTDGVYQLASAASGKCVDVTGASTANSALLIQAACTSAATNQQWRAQGHASAQFNLVNGNSSRCIDVPSSSAVSGTVLQQYGCGDGTKTNQLWTFTASSAAAGKYVVKSVATGLCISDQDSSTAGNNPIVEETCSDIARMQWSFNYVGGPTAAPTTGPTGGSGMWSNTADGFAGTAGGTTGGAGVKNVIIRNLTIGDTAVASDDPDDKDFDYDGIQMDTADHVWIDHNTFTNINDGYIDSRKDTNYLTVSWNVMGNHNKTFGIGWTENTIPRITIHHNWIHDTAQRNPSAGNVLYAHLYNNYLQNITAYGNYSRGTTKMVIENSYFEKVEDPYYYDSTGALTQTGSILVSCTGLQQSGGSTFTPSSFYSYTLDPAASVPSLVKTYAGPQPNIGT